MDEDDLRKIDDSIPAQAPIGDNSRPLRFLITAVVVAIYMALGYLMNLDTSAYQVLGIPILLIFQLAIQRQPLRTAWVRAGPPLRLDGGFVILWLLFSVVPAYDMVTAALRGDFTFAAFAAAALGGAFGLAYALRAMHAATVRQLALCLLTAGGIGVLFLFVGSLGGYAHLPAQTAASNGSAPLSALEAGVGTFLLGPAGFLVEEVFFRGALDTYLHRGEAGVGWLSAVFVSALWGLWHQPSLVALQGSHLLSSVIGLLVAQIAIGVPLSLWWRRSANLVVTDTTHAVLDAARSVLALL